MSGDARRRAPRRPDGYRLVPPRVPQRDEKKARAVLSTGSDLLLESGAAFLGIAAHPVEVKILFDGVVPTTAVLVKEVENLR